MKEVTIDKVVKSVAEQVKKPDDILRMLQGEPESKPKKQTTPVEDVLTYLRRAIVEYIRDDDKKEVQHIVVKPKEGALEDTTGFDPDAPGAMIRLPPAIVYELAQLPVDKDWIGYAADHELGTNSFAMMGGTSPFDLAVKKDLGKSDYLFLLN